MVVLSLQNFWPPLFNFSGSPWLCKKKKKGTSRLESRSHPSTQYPTLVFVPCSPTFTVPPTEGVEQAILSVTTLRSTAHLAGPVCLWVQVQLTKAKGVFHKSQDCSQQRRSVKSDRKKGNFGIRHCPYNL